MVTFEFVLKPCKMYSFNTNIAGLITGVTDAELGYGVKSSVHRAWAVSALLREKRCTSVEEKFTQKYRPNRYLVL